MTRHAKTKTARVSVALCGDCVTMSIREAPGACLATGRFGVASPPVLKVDLLSPLWETILNEERLRVARSDLVVEERFSATSDRICRKWLRRNGPLRKWHWQMILLMFMQFLLLMVLSVLTGAACAAGRALHRVVDLVGRGLECAIPQVVWTSAAPVLQVCRVGPFCLSRSPDAPWQGSSGLVSYLLFGAQVCPAVVLAVRHRRS